VKKSMICLLLIIVLISTIISGCAKRVYTYTIPNAAEVAEIIIDVGGTATYWYRYTESEQIVDFLNLIKDLSPTTKEPKHLGSGSSGGGLNSITIITMNGDKVVFEFGADYFTQYNSGLYVHGLDVHSSVEILMKKHSDIVPGERVYSPYGFPATN